MMKPHVLSRVSREVAYGLHELLKTNAANIHCTDDWYTLFSLLESIGAGVKPPASFQLASSPAEPDTGEAQPRWASSVSVCVVVCVWEVTCSRWRLQAPSRTASYRRTTSAR